MTTTSSNKPSHRVYAVTKRKSGENDWTEIGACWSHGDGKGFNLKLDYLPLTDAELVIRVPREKSASTDAADAAEGGAL
jgi:hypothetical protein